jgi:hypothetical protein
MFADMPEATEPPKRISRFKRRRKEEAARAERAAALAAKPQPQRRPVDELRQLRRVGGMSARVQRRALKAVRRGREPMSRAERHARGMQ